MNESLPRVGSKWKPKRCRASREVLFVVEDIRNVVVRQRQRHYYPVVVLFRAAPEGPGLAMSLENFRRLYKEVIEPIVPVEWKAPPLESIKNRWASVREWLGDEHNRDQMN